MPNQYFNEANPKTHYLQTGPEIWKQTEGNVDVLVASMGTGGTISGVGKYLKEKNPEIQIVGVDPEGSMYHHEFYKTKGAIHPYKVEGIGEDFLPSTLDLNIVDEVITVTDKDAFLTARKLAKIEGVFAGGSAGAAVFAALKIAKKCKDNETIVVILPDTGRNYLNKIYSDDWMISNKFIDSKEKEIIVKDLLNKKQTKIQNVISVDPEDKLNLAIELMKKHDISQLPVIQNGTQIGSIREQSIMKMFINEKANAKQIVNELMEEPLPTIEKEEKIVAPFNLLNKNAILVTENNKIIDIITVIDVINYFLRYEKP